MQRTEELHNLHSSRHIIGTVLSRVMTDEQGKQCKWCFTYGGRSLKGRERSEDLGIDGNMDL